MSPRFIPPLRHTVWDGTRLLLQELRAIGVHHQHQGRSIQQALALAKHVKAKSAVVAVGRSNLRRARTCEATSRRAPSRCPACGSLGRAQRTRDFWGNALRKKRSGKRCQRPGRAGSSCDGVARDSTVVLTRLPLAYLLIAGSSFRTQEAAFSQRAFM
eukprot:GHVU01008615.1.p1 GENE.GHVU01008615.1~~GHVU01008615.1.p1  ORF type:complete len:158 (-),score=7.08 GHVU01008615.1:31-504(-)